MKKLTKLVIELRREHRKCDVNVDGTKLEFGCDLLRELAR